ncbi:hypothetical protein V6N13_057457 [Hibiscus sabdariffa]
MKRWSSVVAPPFAGNARAEVAGTNGKSVEATVAEVDDTLNAELGPSTVEKGSADQVPPAARNVTTPCGSADTVQSDQPCPVVPTKAADATAADSDQPVHDNSTTPTNSAEDNAAARVSIGPVRSSKRVIQGRYEVCHPIQAKRPRLPPLSSGTSPIDSGSDKTRMSSIISPTEVAEVSGQTRQAL